MSSNKLKCRVAYSGIIFYFLYYIVTAAFFISGTSLSLIFWEAGIMLGAPIMLVIMLQILEHTDGNKGAWKTASVVFMTCTVALTWIAHIISLAVVMPLEARDVDIPNYLKFGEYPSVIMAIEYLAWGAGMGLAFIFAAAALTADLKKVKVTMIICGCLCLMGLFGVIFFSELLWLFAPTGFAVGTPIVCVQMILFYKKPQNLEYY